MARKLIKLPSLSRVVAGSIATLELPIGPTYKRIVFECTGTGLAVSHIGKIDVLMNGQVKQTFKNLQRLIDLNAYYKRGADAATQFAVHFERAELHDLTMRRAPGIGTSDLQTFHMEITLPAGGPANLTMVAYAEVDNEPQPVGLFYNVREFPTNAPAAGLFEFDKLPRGAWYAAIHVAKADCTYAEIQANSVKILDASKTALERFQKEASPSQRVPQTAGYTHLDMVTDGDVSQAIRTAALSDFRLSLTMATLGSFDIVTETIEGLK